MLIEEGVVDVIGDPQEVAERFVEVILPSQARRNERRRARRASRPRGSQTRVAARSRQCPRTRDSRSARRLYAREPVEPGARARPAHGARRARYLEPSTVGPGEIPTLARASRRRSGSPSPPARSSPREYRLAIPAQTGRAASMTLERSAGAGPPSGSRARTAAPGSSPSRTRCGSSATERGRVERASREPRAGDAEAPELARCPGPSPVGGGSRRFLTLLWVMAVTDFKLTFHGTASATPGPWCGRCSCSGSCWRSSPRSSASATRSRTIRRCCSSTSCSSRSSRRRPSAP